MDLRQLKCFLCVYTEGNVTRAARRLHLVQPAVSMQIRRFEEELGLQLFERSVSGVTPTSAGRAVYELYSPILSDLQHAHQRAMELHGKVTGKIVIGVNRSVAHSVLGRTLARYDVLHPDVELHVEEDSSEGLVDHAAAGDVDFALVTPHRLRGKLVFETLASEELFLVQRAGAALEPVVSFEALRDLRLVLPRTGHGYRVVIDDSAALTGVQLTPSLEIDSFDPAIDLVSNSDMATIVPAIAISPYVDRLPLRIARIGSPPLRRDIYCVHRRNRPLSLASQAFVEILREELLNAIDKVSTGDFSS